MRPHRLLITAALGAAIVAPAASGATIPVTTTADVVANDGACSLREAVFAARFDQTYAGCAAGTPGEDVIQLEAATYRLAAGGGGEDGNESGDLDTGPANVLRIVGRGAGVTVIGGGGGDRVLDVFTGASLGLADLTVRDGTAPRGGSGGAVRSRGALTVVRVTFAASSAGDGVPAAGFDTGPEPAGSGGAIWSSGRLEVADTLFSGTRAGDGTDAAEFTSGNRGVIYGATRGGDGGAVSVAGGTASLTNVTVTGARAGVGGDVGDSGSSDPGGGGGDGGAIAVSEGAATIVNATFQGNRAGNTGSPQVNLEGTATPGNGGAVAVAAPGTADVRFSTFAGNAVGSGDAGAGVGASIAGATVGGSVLADPGGACATATPAPVVNVTLPGDVTCPGSGLAGDPRLGPLALNGGPVPTILPGAGSVAINAVANVPCPAADARGLVRPQLGACDAGAVEVQPGTPEAVGAPAPGGGGPTATRTLTAVKVGPAAFRVRGRKPLGTTVTFRVSAAGPVVLTVRKAAAGKRSGRRCVTPTRRLRTAKRCVRQVTVAGRVARQARAGVNTFRFTGKLRGRALPPGRYTMVLTLPAAGGAPAVAVTRPFRIRA